MTEADWMTCEDPIDMLLVPPGNSTSERKLRLFCVACCRRVWDHLSPGNRAAVEVAERYADGLATLQELEYWERLSRAYRNDDPDRLQEDEPPSYWCSLGSWQTTLPRAAEGVTDVCDAIRRVARDRSGEWEDVVQARLLRDIAGNPFRPVVIDPSWLTWHDGTVVRLAGVAYEERSLPAGILDNMRLAVLADAVEEAGCANQEVHRHLRDKGSVHVRGCWVVDLLSGKS
jgi:hypothetical protein